MIEEQGGTGQSHFRVATHHRHYQLTANTRFIEGTQTKVDGANVHWAMTFDGDDR